MCKPKPPGEGRVGRPMEAGRSKLPALQKILIVFIITLLPKSSLAHWSGAGGAIMMTCEGKILDDRPALGRIEFSAKCRKDLGRCVISKQFTSP